MNRGVAGFPGWLARSQVSPLLLADVYSLGVVTVNPDPVTYTLIPSLVVLFTLGTPTLVQISAHVVFGKNGGGVRAIFYDNDVAFPRAAAFSGGGETGWYSLPGNNNEVYNQQLHAIEMRVLQPGVHRIDIREAASGNTNACSYGERCLIVETVG